MTDEPVLPRPATTPTAGAPILVLGATGTTGSRVTAALRAAGAPVRAASRTPVAAEDPRVEAVRFAWDDERTWTPALDGVGAVYVVAPPASTAPERVALPLIERARALGAERVVLLSASSVAAGDPGLGVVHAALAAGPPGWAVLRPSWFAQNLLDPAHHVGAAVLAGRDIVTATGHGRVAFVDAADIAAVAADALTSPEARDGEHLITGPEALSYDEVAQILTAATGRIVRHRAVSEDAATDAMIDAGMPRDFASLLAGMESRIAEGSEARVTDTVERLVGRPATGVAEVVAEERGRVPRVYLDHLAAVTGPEPSSVRSLWEPDGVLEFPYAASVGSAERLEGVDEIVDYFDGLRVFRDWSFTDLRAGRIHGSDEWTVEVHGSATLVRTGRPYEQDYVVRFAVAPSGRLAWMREFWDPTRTG